MKKKITINAYSIAEHFFIDETDIDDVYMIMNRNNYSDMERALILRELSDLIKGYEKEFGIDWS